MGRQTIKSRLSGAITASLLVLLVACGGKGVQPVAELPPESGPKAIIKTKFGDIHIRFYADHAPKHVENFVNLAKTGFYNGTIFHRVIPGFMIQGGDPNTKSPLRKDTYGQGGPGYMLKGEFNDIPHKRGIVSMARAQDPDTAGSQFFIVVEHSQFLDSKYTAFGEVTKGIGVADKIVNQPRVLCVAGAKGELVATPPDKGPCDNPIDRVEITVSIVE